jgi:two-component system sensor histidine kinase/response regulator
MNTLALSATGAASRYRFLVDGSLDPVLIADASGHWVEANPAAESLLGFSREELLRARVPDTIVLGLEHAVADDANLPLESGWQGELTLRCKNGALLTVSGLTIRLHDDTGDACALILRNARGPASGALVDASAAPTSVGAGYGVEAELQAAKATVIDANRALRESEARFRGAFDAASIGMALVAIDGRFLQVNPALCGIVGFSEDELLRKTFQEITHPDYLETDRELIQRLLANEITTYQIEKIYLRKQGEDITGRLTVSLVRDPASEPLYFVAQIQDITPFKAAGTALRAAEARYRTLVEQTPAAVYVDAAGALGHAIYISPRIETLIGVTPEEWMSSPGAWMAFIHPEDRERTLGAIDQANESAEKIVLEYRFLARDGRVVWVHDEAALVRDEAGDRQYWQGILIDITDRKLAEEELRAAKEAAEEASRLKSAFLSMATHELRTPLTVISGYVELLADSAEAHLTAEEQEFLEAAQAGARTLSALVDDLLDMARIEAGRMDLVIRPVDVAETVDRVRRMVAAQAAAKELELEVDVEPDLPLIAADVNRLIQILLNLFGNAVKFTERGRVHCAVARVDSGVEIAISDTGIGIAPEALPRIFDEFRQADSGTTRRFGGTGLGLAIAKRLIEMHGGTIAATSEQGVGSRFALWLPAADPGLLQDDLAPIPCSVAPGR